MCLRDPARASGPGRRDDLARLRDSASDLARGLGATFDPMCLCDPARASGPRCRDDSAHLRDSASNPARGQGAIYDPMRLRDSAKALGLRRLDYLESLSDLTQGFRVRVTETGSIIVATSGWPNTDTLRGAV
jgi:hypothetical protein